MRSLQLVLDVSLLTVTVDRSPRSNIVGGLDARGVFDQQQLCC